MRRNINARVKYGVSIWFGNAVQRKHVHVKSDARMHIAFENKVCARMTGSCMRMCTDGIYVCANIDDTFKDFRKKETLLHVCVTREGG